MSIFDKANVVKTLDHKTLVPYRLDVNFAVHIDDDVKPYQSGFIESDAYILTLGLYQKFWATRGDSHALDAATKLAKRKAEERLYNEQLELVDEALGTLYGGNVHNVHSIEMILIKLRDSMLS